MRATLVAVMGFLGACGFDPTLLPFVPGPCAPPVGAYAVAYEHESGDCGPMPDDVIGRPGDCDVAVTHEADACLAEVQSYCWRGDVLVETHGAVLIDGHMSGLVRVRLIAESGAALCEGVYASTWRRMGASQ